MTYQLPVDLTTTDQDTLDGNFQNSIEALNILHGAAPSSPVANQWYHDAATNILYRRNAANTNPWIAVIPDTSAAGGGLLKLTGGTMSGAIAMGSQKITGLAAATANGEALRFEDKTQLQKLQIAIPLADGFNGAAGTYDYILFATEVAITVVSGNIVFLGSGTLVTASDTNHYDFSLRNVTDSLDVTLLTGGAGTTKTTGGSAVTGNARFPLGPVDGTNKNIAANKVISLREIAVGSPTGLTSTHAVVTIYYTNQ